MDKKKINELGDWRGKILDEFRLIIKDISPEIVEEVKRRKPSNSMMGVPAWSCNGIICTGETYKDKIKFTFANGALLKDPAGLFNSSLDGKTRRAIDVHLWDELNRTALKNLILEAITLNLNN